MEIEFDPDTRAATLLHRGLDMADAGTVFSGPCLTTYDSRYDYGERRNISVGRLDGRMALVWTWRGNARRIISIRKANEREQTNYRNGLGRS